MRISQYFLPIMQEILKNAEIFSHQIMLRLGMIRRNLKGIYSFS
ncbi:hypothetical protein [Candidatus Liberibacter sp.]|nr:hypothetical protein [Candidatus Liberibacter sp.]